MSLEKLLEYYSEYDVVKQENTKFESDLLEHNTISYSKLQNKKDYENYYVVYSFTSAKMGSFLEWDMRGH